MTIEYGSHQGFMRLLFRWKGSVWKSVMKQLIAFLVAYAIFSAVYHFGLHPNRQREFRLASEYFRDARVRIPIDFLLGFFVAKMIGRWWEQFRLIALVDSSMFLVSIYLMGDAKVLQVARKMMARYLNLAGILCWRNISIRVKHRFPSYEHMAWICLITPEEKEELEEQDNEYGMYQIPILWSSEMLVTLHKKGFISQFQLDTLCEDVEKLRDMCETLLNYNWVNVPLVYTQTAIIATYGYFLMLLLGGQPSDSFQLDQTGTQVAFNLIIPFVTILELVFWLGWLSVASNVCWPFGDDDEDMELGFVVDKNIEMAYYYANMKYPSPPKKRDDRYWNKTIQETRLPRSYASSTNDRPFQARGFLALKEVNGQSENDNDSSEQHIETTDTMPKASKQPIGTMPKRARRSKSPKNA